LTNPSETVQKICLEAERVFRSYPINTDYKQHSVFLWNKIKNSIFKYRILFNADSCEENYSVLNTHRDQLTNLVIYKYLDIRMFHEIKKMNEQSKIRSMFTKLILFKHQ